MINFSVFFNTQIENPLYYSTLSQIGDRGLAPFRYLFKGKRIYIEYSNMHLLAIHHVASYHKYPDHRSKTTAAMVSSQESMIKTALSVIFLLPGLILGATFKSLAYLSPAVRENHRLAKKYLTPIDRRIGSIDNPIKTSQELREALSNENILNRMHSPTKALIIYGDGNLTINEDPGICIFNPKKVILIGAKLVHEGSATGRLFEKLKSKNKWFFKVCRSEEDALKCKADRKKFLSSKRYRILFTVKPNSQ